MRQLLCFALFAFLAIAITNPAYADATSVGPSFIVNSPGMGGVQARVAMAPGGQFAVVWKKAGASQILFRRFSEAGLPLGPEVMANKPGLNGVATPEIAWNPVGGYVVAWTEAVSQGGLLPSDNPILARRFDANGASGDPLPILVSQSSSSEPRIAVRGDGAFAITWSARGASGDVNTQHVFARTFNGQGIAFGPPFRLGTHTGVVQYHPDLAFTSAGGFLATWTERPADAAPYELDANHIYQRYWGIAGLNKDPSEHRIDVNFWGLDPATASNAKGDVVVAWFPGAARRFVGTGAPLESAEFGVPGGNWIFGEMAETEVGVDAAGGTVFVAKAGYDNQVRCQRFDASGTARDVASFVCNDVFYVLRSPERSPDPSWQPDVAVAGDGSFVVLWYDYRIGTATAGTIRARLFQAP